MGVSSKGLRINPLLAVMKASQTFSAGGSLEEKATLKFV
jgi:hypothetical protein